MSARWRHLRFGLSTVLGLRPRGFFIPYRYAEQVTGPGDRPPYAATEALFAGLRDEFMEFLSEIDKYSDALQAIATGGGEKAPRPLPRFEQGWFPTLDAAVAYTMVRLRKPRRIIEVGSGHSTRFLARAVHDGNLTNTELVSIDPAPRADLEGLNAAGRAIRPIRNVVQDADPAIFAALGPNDLLFIDSSHLLMPGTDVDLLFNRIMPTLPIGCLVQIHDIHLPDDYPVAWTKRAYNEQLALPPLLSSGAWRTLFACRYAATRMAEAVAASVVGTLPDAGAPAGSLWLERV